ncbi:Crp/Fnr family transcriptional regulator [Niveibacterium umoris]|uniref:CRP-like cAMP-binding protein n=1 Tax=Niveibacterium umoris TaxID=1193620 RepID=A0A840BRG3_9RHOO|nr:Crp/Fnr family transcriptional regulator [Niveibacterium umoris]MBB4014262.1 CRP-like cAMP-binding protein [Niveibacterium umoris]
MEQRRKADINGLLSRLPLFAQVEAETVATLAASTQEVRLEKGKLLFQQGDTADGFYVVVYGQVKLGFSAQSGHEKVVEIIGPAHSFGEAVMFMGRPYPVFAQALSDAMVLQIPAQPIFTLIERNGSFARRMLAGMSMRLHSLVQDVESYSLRSSTQRLIGYLLRNADEIESNTAEIDLETSKQVLASRLNLTPETFSRVLHALTEAKLISVNGKHITIHDIARLKAYDN